MKRTFYVIILLALLLGACTPTAVAPAANPVEPTKPAAEEAPKVTEMPVAEEPTKEAAPVANTKIVFANAFDINTLESAQMSSMWNRSIVFSLFDCLVMNDREGKPTPELATEWKRIDPLTWEFKLVKNAKFHNGEPVNAAAVKFSLDRMGSKENKSFSTLHTRGFYQETKIIDDYTVQIITSKPTEIMLWHLAQAFIVEPKWYTEHDAEFVAKNPMGSGPFKFVEWVKDNHILLEANPDYFQGAPVFSEVEYKVIPEASSRINELIVGNVDFLPSIPGDLAKQANSDKSKMVQFMSLRKMFLAMQLGKDGIEPLKKLEVRQAMNYAIDRKSLIDAYLLGSTESLKGVVNPPNTSPNVVAYDYNPEKAKELLTKAGYPNGFDLTLQTQASAYGSDKEINQVIKQNLEQVGIKVNLEILEPAKFQEVHKGKNYPGLLYFGLGTYNSPEIELNTFTCGYTDNSFNYCNDNFAAALDELTTTSDPAKRLELSNKAEEIVWNDVPWLYLWRLPYFQGQSNRIEYEPYLDNYVDVWQIKLK